MISEAMMFEAAQRGLATAGRVGGGGTGALGWVGQVAGEGVESQVPPYVELGARP